MHDDSTNSAPTHFAVEATPLQDPPRRIRSEDIMRGAREVVIEHDGRQYQLRITQNGKLILTA
jgi:hemin uptake protein HemP